VLASISALCERSAAKPAAGLPHRWQGALASCQSPSAQIHDARRAAASVDLAPVVQPLPLRAFCAGLAGCRQLDKAADPHLLSVPELLNAARGPLASFLLNSARSAGCVRSRHRTRFS